MDPKQLLDKLHKLERRQDDKRRYTYDRDQAKQDIVDLIPEVVKVFRKALQDLDRVTDVAEVADRLSISLAVDAPSSSDGWLRRNSHLRQLRTALARWEEIRWDSAT